MAASFPEDYAVVIGIEDYGQLVPLPAATDDASDFARWLMEAGGLPDGNVKLLISPPEASAVVSDPAPILKHITDAWLSLKVGAALRRPPAQKRRIGRRLYFYFSGHGFGPHFDNVGMLLADASSDILTRNMGLAPYRKFFHDHGLFDEIVYILDCCRDDSRGTLVQPPEFTNNPPNPLPPPAREFVVMAARWGEKAFEAQFAPGERRSGLLTKALLEGLGLDGAPKAVDVLDRVTTTSLWSWLQKRVPELNARVGVGQTPEAEGSGRDEPMVLATFPLSPAQAVTLQVTLTMPLTSTLMVLMVMHDSTRAEKERLDLATLPAGQPWVVALRPGFRYAVTHLDSGVSREFDLTNAAGGAAVPVNFPM
ncbi:MAG TPA: caspase family protein [Roseomonas sp.]|jgi:hypothetical protein